MILAILSAALVSVAAGANTDIQQAYQREYAFLVAQKEALLRQKREMEEGTQRTVAQLENKLKGSELELARAQSANEKAFEEIQALERRKREEAGRESVLLSLWKRADRQVKEAKHALAFDPEKLEVESLPPESITLADIGFLGQEALKVLAQSSEIEEFRGAYMNQEQRLVEGTLVRFGRVAAVALQDSGALMLGPDGEGRLTVMEGLDAAPVLAFLKKSAEPSFLLPLYVFQSLRERATIRRPGGPLESLADASPALFLALLFGMVGWLFFQLARV